MYNEYFGFKESPFSIAPDPRYLYMTAQHRDALAHLVYGLNSEGGCILLTGEVGTGKTTICRCLLEQLPEQANVALVLNPKLSEVELLETICDELKITYPNENNSLKTYTDRIYDFLISRNQKNEKTVLIIDEAQNLDSKVLEQLRLLTNLETDKRKLLQIIILGQPELLEILAKNEMRQLAQRITARFHLEPLNKIELKAYLNHRLAIAGQNIQIFPDKTLKILYRLSKGIPRLINIISDRALLGAYVENQYTVTPSIIKKAANEVFGELKNVEQHQKNKQRLFLITSSAAILATVLFFTISILLYFNNEQAVVISSESLHTIETTPSNISPKLNIDTFKTKTPTIERIIETPTSSAPNRLTDFSVNTQQETINKFSEIPKKKKLEGIESIINNTEISQASAFQALFSSWNLNYISNTNVTACQQAINNDLHCLYKQGNINSLKRYNRPAVLVLNNKLGEQKHITITAINDGTATIFADNKKHTVQLTNLDNYWYGQYILLWKKPKHYNTAIIPGANGDIISWLSEKIAKLNKKTLDSITYTYDKTLVGEVIAFQKDHGLNADGIVGPVTILNLNELTNNNTPTLVKPTNNTPYTADDKS